MCVYVCNHVTLPVVVRVFWLPVLPSQVQHRATRKVKLQEGADSSQSQTPHIYAVAYAGHQNHHGNRLVC